MAKPEFDPNQPFEPADQASAETAPDQGLQINVNAPGLAPVANKGVPQAKPAFDPNQPFEEVASPEDEAQYGTPEQQAIAGLEGAARGVAGPLAPLAEKAAGIPEESILGREKANPITADVGEGVGLVGSSLTGMGEGALLSKLGEGAAAISGLGKSSKYVARVGSSIVANAAEMAALSGGDELSRMIVHDPDATSQSAIANIGMGALLGGATGGVLTGVASPLWKATVGDKVGEFLGTLTSKLGGVEGGVNKSADLAAKAGVDIPAELRAKIDDAPGAAEYYSKLNQTDTSAAGRKLQALVSDYHDGLGDAMVQTLGHDPSYVEKLPDLSKYNSGQEAGQTLHESLSKEYAPIKDQYNKIDEQFKSSPVSLEDLGQVKESIAQMALDNGWHKMSGSPQQKLANSVMEDLAKQENASDIKKYITNLRDSNPFGSDTYKAAKDIAKELSTLQQSAIEKGIIAKGGGSAQAQEALGEYQALRGRYAQLMNKYDALNEHLHVGSYNGPESFLKNLKDMTAQHPERIIDRLNGSKNAAVLDTLAQASPETLAKVRQYHIDNALRSSSDSFGKINPYKLSASMDKMTPQVKNLVADAPSQQRIQALSDIATSLKDPTHNWSNSGRTADKLTHGAMSPIELIGALTGHGWGAIGAHLARMGMSEGKDSLRYSMLKFLGSNQSLKSEGFRAMAATLHNGITFDKLLDKGAKSVFGRSGQVAISRLAADASDRDRLDKQVSFMQDNPEKLKNIIQGGDVGHYLPEHQQAISQNIAGSVQYLQGLKPREQQNNPLDTPIKPSAAAQARYNRALDIANAPESVMARIKDGTLQASDIQDLHALYPAVYQRMAQKLSAEMQQKSEDGEPIPYKTRQALSLFLGQPLDGTMVPGAIQAAQPMPKPPPQQPQQGQKQPKKNSKGLESLNKGSKEARTPEQAAEAARAERK